MSAVEIVDLNQCTRFRQTLAATPPVRLHATTVTLVLLILACLGWSICTQANLVIIAPGRVRAVEVPVRVFAPEAPGLQSRVARVNFKHGEEVVKGQTLLTLDTRSLDTERQRFQATIDTASREVAMLDNLLTLTEQQYNSAREKADAELQHAIDVAEQAERRQASQRRGLAAEVTAAEEKLKRFKQLRQSRAASASELEAAQTAFHQIRERLAQAELPVDRGRIDVLQKARTMVDREYLVKRTELQSRRTAKQGQIKEQAKRMAQLDLSRSQAVLKSPIDGIVVSPSIRVGDLLQEGAPAIEIARCDAFVFEGIVSSQDVGPLKPAMHSRVKFDAFDFQRYGTLTGTVSYVSPDSKIQSASTTEGTKNHGGAAGYVVRIQLDRDTVGRAGDKAGRVKLGLSGTAEIVTARERLLWIFLKKIRQTISLS